MIKHKEFPTKGAIGGAAIALAAMASAIVSTNNMDVGISKLLSGFIFSGGLMIICMSQSLLFTGCCADWYKEKDVKGFLKFLLQVYLLNYLGVSFILSFVPTMDHNIYETLIKIGIAKVNLPYTALFLKGFMCNVLVCLATLTSRRVNILSSLTVSIGIPITLFVVCGFEHSIANMFFLPAAKYCGANISWLAIFKNLFFVTIGNLIGGIFISIYWHKIRKLT